MRPDPPGRDQHTPPAPFVVGDEILNLPVELDGSAADALRPRIEQAIRRATHTVRLHASRVRFVDSGGLRLLLEATRHGNRDGTPVVLCDPSPQVRELLRLSGCTDAVHVDETDPAPTAAPRVTPPPGHDEGPSIHAFPVPRL